jgi:hypothetical protein
MQKAREQKRQAALDEAASLYELSAVQGQPWNPEAEARVNGGFLFSPFTLEEAITRRTRLQAARLAESGLFPRTARSPYQQPPAKFGGATPRAA